MKYIGQFAAAQCQKKKIPVSTLPMVTQASDQAGMSVSAEVAADITIENVYAAERSRVLLCCFIYILFLIWENRNISGWITLAERAQNGIRQR